MMLSLIVVIQHEGTTSKSNQLVKDTTRSKGREFETQSHVAKEVKKMF